MEFSFTFENTTIPKPNLIPVQYWSRGETFLTRDNEIPLVIWKFQSIEANPYSEVFTLVPRTGNACLSPLSVAKKKKKKRMTLRPASCHFMQFPAMQPYWAAQGQEQGLQATAAQLHAPSRSTGTGNH